MNCTGMACFAGPLQVIPHSTFAISLTHSDNKQVSRDIKWQKFRFSKNLIEQDRILNRKETNQTVRPVQPSVSLKNSEPTGSENKTPSLLPSIQRTSARKRPYPALTIVITSNTCSMALVVTPMPYWDTSFTIAEQFDPNSCSISTSIWLCIRGSREPGFECSCI